MELLCERDQLVLSMSANGPVGAAARQTPHFTSGLSKVGALIARVTSKPEAIVLGHGLDAAQILRRYGPKPAGGA